MRYLHDVRQPRSEMLHVTGVRGILYPAVEEASLPSYRPTLSDSRSTPHRFSRHQDHDGRLWHRNGTFTPLRLRGRAGLGRALILASGRFPCGSRASLAF